MNIDLNSLIKGVTAAEFGLVEFSVSVLFSLAAGIICMFLYRLYFANTYDRNESLTRSFVIIAPSISAIFWAIQYSLPLSLGLLGALSFVRFRTPIKKSEDIGFILLVIALSLLSSVYRFFAAGILLGIVIAVVLVRSLILNKGLSFLRFGTHLSVFVSTGASDISVVDGQIRKALPNEFAGLKDAHLSLRDAVQKEKGYNLRYSVYFKKYTETEISRIVSVLGGIEALDKVEVFVGKAV